MKIREPAPGSDRRDVEKELERDSKSGIKLGTANGSRSRPLTFKGFKQVMKVLRDGKRAAGAGRRKTKASRWLPPRISRATGMKQQVAVRLNYVRNKEPGQWQAYGRYLERESATGKNAVGRGFTADADDVQISPLLKQWQDAQDPNLFKFIISPGHGDQLDMPAFTKEYMAHLEKALGTKLEWVAAAHYNTDDPHAHVALRGIDQHGRPLHIPREFIKGPLREIAMDLATAKLGYRTLDDVRQSRERQITQQRFTELDRALLRTGETLPSGRVKIDYSEHIPASASEAKKELRIQLLKRLAHLEQLGLASRGTGRVWELDPALQVILRARQQADDRLKTLHNHRAMVSDPRLPLAPMPTTPSYTSGRLIGTGLDDATGKAYMLLESTQGSVIYLYQSSAAEKARGAGMQVGDFVVVEQKAYLDSNGATRLGQKIFPQGSADQSLSDARTLRAEVKRHVERTGKLPEHGTWSGWLGSFQAAVHQEALAMQKRGVLKEQGGRMVFNAGVAQGRTGP